MTILATFGLLIALIIICAVVAREKLIYVYYISRCISLIFAACSVVSVIDLIVDFIKAFKGS